MAGSLQQRLQQHAEVPPAGAWNRIAARLDDEYSAQDAKLSQKLEHASVEPPLHIWTNIAQELAPATVAPGTRVVPMIVRRTAYAAAVALLLIAASVYFIWPVSRETRQTPALSEVRPAPEKKVSDSAAPERAATILQDTTADSRSLANNAPETRTRTPVRTETRANADAQPVTYEPEADYIEEAAYVFTPQPVRSVQQISVSAPPIRDSRGNIIMDLDVIREPGQPYITVTGPNGNQTRISTKFLNCLRYINGNISFSEMDRDAAECRTKFDHWRKKLLTEAAFMPSSDNFFDIFEMKEMIED
jgi:hypothetical protein